MSPENPLVIDLDASLLTSHSEKEDARPTWKKGFGFHPLSSFLDHGILGTDEPLATLLRPGYAGSNTAADHIQVVKDSVTQLSKGYRSGRKIMIRTDSASGAHVFLHWPTARGRNFSYSVGFPIHGTAADVLPLVPNDGWTKAYDSDRAERDGAWVADITGMLDLSSWPAGMPVIVRKEIPHIGAQLRITDIDGRRYTAIATNQKKGQLADLEVHHRTGRATPDQRHETDRGTQPAIGEAAAVRPHPKSTSITVTGVEPTPTTAHGQRENVTPKCHKQNRQADGQPLSIRDPAS